MQRAHSLTTVDTQREGAGVIEIIINKKKFIKDYKYIQYMLHILNLYLNCS